jgi:type IV pilus assembly protein PilQ
VFRLWAFLSLEQDKERDMRAVAFSVRAVLAIVTIHIALGAYAQDSIIDVPEDDTAVIVPSAVDPSLITIRLNDQPLDVVVNMFNRLAGINLIANPGDLKGMVTLNLKDVHWRSALVSVLSMHNLALVETLSGSGVYTVVPEAPDTPPPTTPLELATIFLSYAKVDDVLPVIEPMLAEGGSAAPFPSRNAIVVRSTPENLKELEKLVRGIDILRKQVFIEAKFMELNDEAIEDLGVNWQVLSGFGLSAAGLQWTLNDENVRTRVENDAFTVSDTSRASDSRILKYGPDGQLLVPPTIETYTQIPGSDPPQYTFFEETEPSRTLEASTAQDFSQTYEKSNQRNREKSDIRTAVFGIDDFRVILSALKQMNGVSIVSNPKIVVANEESAEIHIGQRERPFIASITAGQEGIAPVVTYNPGEAVDFGVKLTVTPTINTSNKITVAIEPELTRFVRDAVAPNGQTYPIIATKKISSTFCLESGRTVAIGGLTETEEREITSKVPLLGDIPLIGKYLFSHTHKQMAQKETIIFVTVGLANPEAIEEDSGLPENTDLTRRRILHDTVRRRERAVSLAASQRAVTEKLDALDRLLNKSNSASATPEAVDDTAVE